MTWADSSGNGHTATAVGTPTYQTNVVNGKPVVRLVNPIEYFTLPDALFTGMTAGEAFAVLKKNNDPALVDGESGLWSWTTGASIHYPYTDGIVYEGFGSTLRKTTGNPTPSLSSFHLLNVWSAANDWALYLNGTVHHATASNTVGFPVAAITLGRSVAAGPVDYGGDMAEVILYEAKLSAGDRTTIKAYIANKYGLTIA